MTEEVGKGAGRLAGKRVLITGTAGGQGAAVQRAFCEEGAAVVGCDIVEGGAEATASELTDAGYRAHGRTVDLADFDAAGEWVDWAAETLGGVDVLYNNAGATDFAPFGEMTREVWEFAIRNELDNVFYVTLPVWKHMTAYGGSIINIGSVCGMVADAALGQSAHTAAKAGVIALSQQLAAEGGPHGIRVNCISPGVIASPATDDNPPEIMQHLIDHTFLRRIGTPDDIVPAALFLASDESAYVTGLNLVVGGGWGAGTPYPARHAAEAVTQSS
jgi:meso-butanediol dehydrogenase/(S,S)-butanediol dehydrogenase/diacetyl reductase